MQFLSAAGGALIDVSMLMYNSARKQSTNSVIMLGIFVGLFAGFIIDLMIVISGAWSMSKEMYIVQIEQIVCVFYYISFVILPMHYERQYI